MAALTLLLPTGHVSQIVLGGRVPIVPGVHARKGAQSSQSQFGTVTFAQIFEPTGTVTDAEPPVATILPFSTRTH